jgi:hypothetical protein
MAYFPSASLLARGERDSPNRRIIAQRSECRQGKLTWQYSRAVSLCQHKLDDVCRRSNSPRRTVWQFPLPLVENPSSTDPGQLV